MVSNEQLANRFAQFAWAIHTGDTKTLEDLRKVIEAGGGTWKENNGQITCMGPSGIRGGFIPGHEDPVTSGVILAFLLVGQMWPSVDFVRKAFGLLNKWWKEETKGARKTRKEE